MIEAAEKRGDIQPGDTLVEGTAGNTGIGLALVAQQKGYKLILVVPGQDEPREDLQPQGDGRAGGADALGRRQGPSGLLPGPGRAHRAAKRPARTSSTSSAIPDNPAAHEFGTGPEILRQMDGDLDAIVFGCGSSGTMTGLSRCFAQHSPKTELILADPVGSILAEYINDGTLSEKSASWMVEGIGEDFLPPISDFSRVKTGLRDHRQGKLPHRARAAGEGRHPRRLVDRHAARRRAEVLPRADHAQARARVRLRHRQQVPVEDVQRLLDAGQRLPRARAARRPARPDPAPVLAARHRRGRARTTCWSPPTSA